MLSLTSQSTSTQGSLPTSTKFEDAVPEQVNSVHVGVTNFQTGTTIALLLAPGAGYPTDGTFTNVATTSTGATGTGMTVDIAVIGGVVTEIVENSSRCWITLLVLMLLQCS